LYVVATADHKKVVPSCVAAMTTAAGIGERRGPSGALHLLQRSFRIARHTFEEMSEDRIPSVAAGATFFMLLALFPAIASVVSLYGMVADRASIAHVVDATAPYLPGGAIAVLDEELRRLIVQPPGKLNLAFVFGLVIALWSASGGIKSLADGLNVAYEKRETRSFAKLTAHALVATAACIAFAASVIGLAVVLPVELGAFPYRHLLGTAFGVLRWPVLYGACILMLDLLYQIGPDRPHARWHWGTWGSAVASLLWILGTLLFSWYAKEFGSYDRVYGNLGAIVGFLTWIWLSLLVMLAGAELNCEIDRRRGD
jgi:membrane protein